MLQKIKNWFSNLRLTYKLILSFSLILLMLMVFIYAYFPARQKEAVNNEMNQRISYLAHSIALGYGIAFSENSYTPLYELGSWVKKDKSFGYYCVYDENNQPVDMFPDDCKIEINPNLKESIPASRGKYLEIKVPIRYKEKSLGSIILGMDLKETRASIHRINFTTLIAMACIFAIGFLVILFLSALINKPIHMLMESVNRILSHGEYYERVGITTRDEAGILASRFDEMVAMIEGRDIELKQQFEELQTVNALKDEFLAVTTHDLRSPITAILGFADIISKEENISPELLKRINHIKSSAEFLANLVNDILEISRLESGKTELKMKPVSLGAVIKSSIDTLHYMAMPKDISIDFVDKTKGKDIVRGDHDALLRIVNNLISNSIKFTPRGGKIEVMVGSVRDYFHLSVKDNGIGIPQDKVGQLFQSYTNTSRRGTANEKGTGLGLSITKTLVQKHGGDIHVSSREGHGSCFTVKIPVFEPSE